MCTLSVIAVRRYPDPRSEMISQLLFGELCTVLLKKHNLWTKIITAYDELVGWVDGKQLTFMSEKKYNQLNKNGAYAIDICSPAIADHHYKQVLLCSYLPDYDGITLQLPKYRLRYSGQTLTPKHTVYRNALLRKLAFKYLGSPEIPGGKSPFGIDSGAFIQNIFKVFGVRLPRYPFQQVEEGEVIDFNQQAGFGDLAFFSDEDGKINHVGLLIEDNKIIHVYGEVREDYLDHVGIFNRKRKRYTHMLRIIKRIIHSQE